MTELSVQQQHDRDIKNLRTVGAFIYSIYPSLANPLNLGNVAAFAFNKRDQLTAQTIGNNVSQDTFSFRGREITSRLSKHELTAVSLSEMIIRQAIRTIPDSATNLHQGRDIGTNSLTVSEAGKYNLGLTTSSDWIYAQLNLIKDSQDPFKDLEILRTTTSRLMALPLELATIVTVFSRPDAVRSSFDIENKLEIIPRSPLGNLLRFVGHSLDSPARAMDELKTRVNIFMELVNEKDDEKRDWIKKNLALPLASLPRGILGNHELAVVVNDIYMDIVDGLPSFTDDAQDPFQTILNIQESLPFLFKEGSPTYNLLQGYIDDETNIQIKHLTLPNWNYEDAFTLVCPALPAKLNIIQARAALAAYYQLEHPEILDSSFEFSDLFETLDIISNLLADPTRSQRNIGSQIEKILSETQGIDPAGNAGKVIGELFEIAKNFLTVQLDIENEVLIALEGDQNPRTINHQFARSWKQTDRATLLEAFKDFMTDEKFVADYSIYRNNGNYKRYGMSIQELLQKLKQI